MFAPIGFRLFQDINALVTDATFTKYPLASKIPEKGDGSVDYFRDPHCMASLYSNWLMDRILNFWITTTYIASPDGDVMKASSLFFLPSRIAEEQEKKFDFREPKVDNFESEESFVNSVLSSFEHQYRYFNASSGTIEMIEPQTESQSQRNNFEVENNLVERFVGWAVCFKENEFPQDVADLRKLDDPILDETRRQKVGGRPLLAKNAAIAFVAKYPSGRGNKTWKEIENEIGVTSKTITAGLDQIGWKKKE
jgi:hypothetical protein